MNLSRVFHTSLYTLVILAAWMLAFGEESLFPSGLTILLAAFHLVIGRRTNRLTIGSLTANLLGLAALIYSAVEFMDVRQDARLIAGAHFLVYITWVVLLQAKGIRQYWWLSALSLLQVSLGAVMTTQSGTYGLAMLAYLPLALWTLSVFTLYQGAFQLGGLNDSAAEESTVSGPLPTTVHTAASAASTTERPAELARLIQRQFASDNRATYQHGIQQDKPGKWISRRFVFAVFGLAATGLMLGMLIFLFVPRVSLGAGRFGNESMNASAKTGFTNKVRLGQVGEILESVERVMRVRLFERFDSENERVLKMEEFLAEWGLEEPLFRGAVLDIYEEGNWKNSHLETSILQPMMSAPLETNIIRQEYTVDLAGMNELFAMRPISLGKMWNPYAQINFSDESGVLFGPTSRRQPVEYLVYSRRRTVAEKISGKNNFGHLPGKQSLREYEQNIYRQLPPRDRLKGLRALAEQVTQPDRLIAAEALSPPLRKAKTLEHYLRDSGEYSYSLNMQVDNPALDPIEEFVTERKQGHCEYFGTALALMLRAVDIPSRLVVGYKGADYHPGSRPEDGYYEVQQRHAHAWVEAFVDGEWIVLDAVPSGRDEMVQEVAKQAHFWSNAKNSISDLWSTYVVSLSFDRQQRSLYDPLTSDGKWSFRTWTRRVTDAFNLVRDVVIRPEVYFSQGRSARFAIFVVAALLAWRYWRRIAQRIEQWTARANQSSFFGRIAIWFAALVGGRPSKRRVPSILFYQRFLDLLERVGLAPEENQTQREFAVDIAQMLHDRLVPADLQDFPGQMADLFYRVRFGEQPLDPSAAAELDGKLQKLAESLQGWRMAKPA